MSVTRRLDEEHAQVTITIEGRFDFSQHKSFREAYRDIDPKAMGFIIDLADASYLDSSALGMLLLLREYAGSEKGPVRISGCGEDVRRVLKIANFEKLFILD